MSAPYRTAYSIAQDRWRAQGRRLQHVKLPPPLVLGHGVKARPAEEVPFTPRPISILAPKAETAADVHEFVMQQFPAKARRLAR